MGMNNEVSFTTTANFDRASELKAFDDTKDGVKGLIDARVTKIPCIFCHNHPHNEFENSASGSIQLVAPSIDLDGIHKDPIRRKGVVEKIGEASETWGFFQVVNHGIPMGVLEEIRNGVLRFFEQDAEVKKAFYSRDPGRPLAYNSNFDLYSSQAAN